MAKDDNRVKED